MNPGIFIVIAQALIEGIPKIVEAIKAGRDPGDMKLDEFISKDALDQIRATNQKVDDYLDSLK